MEVADDCGTCGATFPNTSGCQCWDVMYPDPPSYPCSGNSNESACNSEVGAGCVWDGSSCSCSGSNTSTSNIGARSAVDRELGNFYVKFFCGVFAFSPH